MRLSAWLSWIYTACGLVFLGRGVLAAFSPPEVFTLPVLFLAAGYCFVWPILLRRGSCVAKEIMLVAGAILLVAYVFRLLVLVFLPSEFAFRHLPVFSEQSMLRAVGFLLAGTLAFWLGVWLGTRGRPDRQGTVREILVGRFRTPIVAFGFVVGLAGLLLPTFTGIGLPQGTGSPLAYAGRLVPVGAVSFVLMYLAVTCWDRLTPLQRVGIAVFFAARFAALLLGGKRGALFEPIVILLLVLVAVYRDPIVRRRWVAAGLALGLVVLPTFLTVVIAFREALYGGQTLSLAFERGLTFYNVFDLPTAVLSISDRLQLFDSLVAATNYTPAGLEQYLHFLVPVGTFVEALIPDQVWASEAPAAGSLFGVFYQGLPFGNVEHAGAWSGFGFFHAYFGIFALPALAGWGAMVGSVMTRFRSSLALSVGLDAYFLFTFVWLLFASGNLDTILAAYVSDIVIVVSFLWFMSLPFRVAGAGPGFLPSDRLPARC